MKALLVGPLPPPVDGCSYANSVLLESIQEVDFAIVDTSTPVISEKQGQRFSIRKAISFLRAYAGCHKVFSVDVVYLTPGQTFFGFMKYAPFMSLAIALRRPYVVHLHGNHLGAHYSTLGGLKRRLFHFYASRMAAGIVLSESLRQNFDQLLPSEKVYVVENFANDELLYTPTADKPDDKPRILYLSNLMRGKGILEFLDALLLLKQREIKFEAVLAGRMEIGIETDVTDRLNILGDCVSYLGPVEGQEKLDLLAHANVFALPTYYVMEGQPISLLEGLASGNIILTTSHAGIPDIIDESNGYVVPPRDVDAIANAISDIAEDLPGKVLTYSAHNIAYARSRFTQTRFVSSVRDIMVAVSDNNRVKVNKDR